MLDVIRCYTDQISVRDGRKAILICVYSNIASYNDAGYKDPHDKKANSRTEKYVAFILYRRRSNEEMLPVALSTVLLARLRRRMVAVAIINSTTLRPRACSNSLRSDFRFFVIPLLRLPPLFV